MDAQQLEDYILAGNSAAMDWYALSHNQALPSQSLTERLFGADFGPISPQVGLAARGVTGTQLLLVGAAIVGLIYFLRK